MRAWVSSGESAGPVISKIWQLDPPLTNRAAECSLYVLLNGGEHRTPVCSAGVGFEDRRSRLGRVRMRPQYDATAKLALRWAQTVGRL